MQTVFYLLLLSALGLALGAAAVGPLPALLVLAVSLLVSTAAYWGRSRLTLRRLGGRPLSYWEAPDLHALTGQLAARAGLPTPRLYLLPASQANALAVTTAHESAIGVTAGLVRQFPANEIAAVIAHELAHIKNRDGWIALVASGLAGVAIFFGQMLLWGLSLASAAGVPGLTGALLAALPGALLLPIVTLALRMAISREREFLADQTAARLVGDPGLLADALRRLEQVNRAPWWMRWLGLAPEHDRRGLLARLLSSHPPTSDRVARLERRRGGSRLRLRLPPYRAHMRPLGFWPSVGVIVWRW